MALRREDPGVPPAQPALCRGSPALHLCPAAQPRPRTCLVAGTLELGLGGGGGIAAQEPRSPAPGAPVFLPHQPPQTARGEESFARPRGSAAPTSPGRPCRPPQPFPVMPLHLSSRNGRWPPQGKVWLRPGAGEAAGRQVALLLSGRTCPSEPRVEATGWVVPLTPRGGPGRLWSTGREQGGRRPGAAVWCDRSRPAGACEALCHTPPGPAVASGSSPFVREVRPLVAARGGGGEVWLRPSPRARRPTGRRESLSPRRGPSGCLAEV